MNLKIGGSNVGKIMYNGQEFGGSKKLESGTLLGIKFSETDKVVLTGVNKDLSNVNGLSVTILELSSSNGIVHMALQKNSLLISPEQYTDNNRVLNGATVKIENIGSVPTLVATNLTYYCLYITAL